jgi:small subunit ribosomal protein S16
MLKIKLARFGKKDQPHYRIVVTEARSKRDGQYAALLGHYAPTQSPKTLDMDLKAYQEWLAKGAQPTPTVASLAKRYESGTPFPPKAARPSKKTKAKQAAAAEVEAAAATAASEAQTAEAVAPEAAPEATAEAAPEAEAEVAA